MTERGLTRSKFEPEKDDAYEVGYKKPPANTRFKPGRSGNPKGRPKDSKNLLSIVSEVADEQVQVDYAGKPKKISKRELIVRQLVNKAVQGHPKATETMLSLLRELDAKTEGQKSGFTLTEKDAECMRTLGTMYSDILGE